MRPIAHENACIYRSLPPEIRHPHNISTNSNQKGPLIHQSNPFLEPFAKMNPREEGENKEAPSYKRAWEDATKVIEDLFKLLKAGINGDENLSSKAVISTTIAYINLAEQFKVETRSHLETKKEYNRLKAEIESSISDLEGHLDNTYYEPNVYSYPDFSFSSHSFSTSPVPCSSNSANNIQNHILSNEHECTGEITIEDDPVTQPENTGIQEDPIRSLSILTKSIK